MACPAADGLQGQACEASSAAPLQPHSFFQKTYFLPTFCDVCAGVILGSAYKCTACGQRCHIGYGKGTEDCYGEALVQACDPANSGHVQGKYRFGDLTKQKKCDVKSRARSVVKQVFVEEQKEFGKIDKIKELVVKTRTAIGDKTRVNKLLLCCQLGSLMVLVLVTGLVLLICKGFGSRAFTIGLMQAASNASWMLGVEALLAMLVWLLCVKLRCYSAIIHRFVYEMFGIQLNELGIDLLEIAAAGKSIAHCSLSVTMILLFVAFAVWVQAISAIL